MLLFNGLVLPLDQTGTQAKPQVCANFLRRSFGWWAGGLLKIAEVQEVLALCAPKSLDTDHRSIEFYR
jgi:hypothetical protein